MLVFVCVFPTFLLQSARIKF